VPFNTLRHLQGFFQGLPVCGSIILVPPDALGHFLIQSLSRGQIGFRARKFLGELLGKMALPTPRSTGNKNHLFIHKSFLPQRTQRSQKFKCDKGNEIKPILPETNLNSETHDSLFFIPSVPSVFSVADYNKKPQPLGGKSWGLIDLIKYPPFPAEGLRDQSGLGRFPGLRLPNPHAFPGFFAQWLKPLRVLGVGCRVSGFSL